MLATLAWDIYAIFPGDLAAGFPRNLRTGLLGKELDDTPWVEKIIYKMKLLLCPSLPVHHSQKKHILPHRLLSTPARKL